MLNFIRSTILNRLVLRPSRHPVDSGAQTRIQFETSSGTGEYFVQQSHEDNHTGDLLVLKFPGTAGRAERSSLFPLTFMPNVRGTVATWNPPGYGGSGGKATLESIADGAIDFANEVFQRHHQDGAAVWLIGNSLGSCTAMNVASHTDFRNRIDGLVVRNPPPLADVVMNVAHRYPLGKYLRPVTKTLPDRMDAIATASKIQAATLMLQSQLDTLVPPELQDQIFDRLPDAKQRFIVEGIGHHDLIPAESESDLSERLMWLWSRRDG